MPCVSDIEADFDPEPREGAFDWHVEFALGADPASDDMIVMSVMLVSNAGLISLGRQSYDLKFGLRRKSKRHEWKVDDPMFDQAVVGQFVPSDKRAMVLDLVIRAVAGPLRRVKPRDVTMSTYDENLPLKAMNKFTRIETCLCENGYRSEDQYTDHQGKVPWHFSRIA